MDSPHNGFFLEPEKHAVIYTRLADRHGDCSLTLKVHFSATAENHVVMNNVI